MLFGSVLACEYSDYVLTSRDAEFRRDYFYFEGAQDVRNAAW